MATLTIADLDNGKRDLETVDAVANSQADTTTTRYGQPTLTLAGALRRLGWQAPVPYAPGMAVASGVMTVEKGGVVYRPDPALVPFTTGAWNPDQWRVVQNTRDSGRVYQFPTLADAQSAAASLPDGSTVIVEGVSQGHVRAGGYLPDSGVPSVTLPGYNQFDSYSGRANAVELTDSGVKGLWVRNPASGKAANQGTVRIVRGEKWERLLAAGESFLLSWFDQPAFHDRVNAASTALNAQGGGEIVLNEPSYTQTGTVNVHPYVRIRGQGIDKTRIDFTGPGEAFVNVPNGAARHRGSKYSDFLINSTRGKSGGATAFVFQNTTFGGMEKVQAANFTIGVKFPMLAGGVLSGAYFNKFAQCWFPSCTNAIWFSGAANRNTFDTNSYTDCDVAYNFSENNNVCETNTFINENIEGCKSWAEWPVSAIYSQTWVGITIENPASNGYVCLVRDPGRQVFVNLSLIPSQNPSALSFFKVRQNWSDVFASVASSGGVGVGTRVSGRLEVQNSILRGIAGVTSYSGSIVSGASTVVTASVAGATVGSLAYAFADKDLLGCVLQPWVSAPGVVSVRIQNGSHGNVTLSGITIKTHVEYSNL